MFSQGISILNENLWNEEKVIFYDSTGYVNQVNSNSVGIFLTVL